MDYKRRINSVQSKLSEWKADAFLVEDPTDLYYLTGISCSTGQMLITLAEPIFFLDNRYFEKGSAAAPCRVILSDNTPITKWMKSGEGSAVKILAFDSDKTSYKRFQELQQLVTVTPVSQPITWLRMIKDEEEIALLRKAAELGSEGFDYVQSLLQPGITESDLAIELEIFWKKRGSKGTAFEPIIAFGPNSALPHHRAGAEKLKDHVPVLIDIGVNLAHYHSDMTRVLFFGEPDAKMAEIYAIVAEAQEMALKLCRPGSTAGAIDAAARGHITEKGYGEQFKHGTGHGVGLEIHELPTLRSRPPFDTLPLQKGMVVTVEPGIYIPGLGGVRIEDTVVITDEGHDNLTARTKRLTMLHTG